jgi:hypothetical protein
MQAMMTQSVDDAGDMVDGAPGSGIAAEKIAQTLLSRRRKQLMVCVIHRPCSFNEPPC